MASGFKPPAKFDFCQPERWPEWKAQFERFHIATELKKKDEDVQTSCLIYAMGPEAEKVLANSSLTADERKVYRTVMAVFDTYFTPRRNVIHERAQFHQRQQKDSESVEEYVRALYELAKYADFADKDNTIRDRLVLGARDRELSEKLQLESDLTLEKAITLARQNETVKAQLLAQRGASASADAVKRSSGRGRGRAGSSRGGRGAGASGQASNQRQDSVVKDCKYCGRTHARQKCPAYGKECRACSKKNHFAAVCRQKAKTGKHVNEIEEEEDEAFLFSVESELQETWRTDVKIAGIQTTFKIDTGADVSIMTTSTYNKLKPRPELEKSGITLRSPGGIVQCLGKTQLDFEVKGSSYPVTVYVTNSQDNLLSREAATRMNLVARIDNVFGELNKTPIKTPPVKIEIEEGAQP